MWRKMTRRAFAGKWGCRGASGSAGWLAAASRRSSSSDASAREPRPMPQFLKNWRRVWYLRISCRRSMLALAKADRANLPARSPHRKAPRGSGRRLAVHLEPFQHTGRLGDQLAGTRSNVVRGAGDAHQRGVHLAKFQRLIELLRLGNGSAMVRLASQEHGRRRHLADKRQGRSLEVMFGLLPRWAGEPVAREERVHVGCQHETVPVDDRLGGYRGAEAVRPADDPRGQDTPAAAPGHEQVVRIHVAAAEHRINAGHQVVEIVAGVRMVNQVGELLTVAGAPAR